MCIDGVIHKIKNLRIKNPRTGKHAIMLSSLKNRSITVFYCLIQI